MKKTFLLFFLFFAASGALSAQDLGRLKETLAQNPALKDAQYSVYAKYIGGKDIVSINPDSRLSPASVLKLYTTAAALDILGPAFRFKTEVYTSGPIKRGTLRGDIYIKGGGDPTLGSLRMHGTPGLEELADNWALNIKNIGIDKVAGAVYADNSIYGGVTLPWRTSYLNIGSYYAAPVDGLSARDNTYEIYFEPCRADGEPAKVLKMDPEIKGLAVNSYVKAYARPAGAAAYVTFTPGSNAASVWGGIPTSQKPLEIAAAMPSPALFMADYLKTKLAEEGVKVKGSAAVLAPASYEDKKLILTQHSPPLADIINYTNKRSFNLYADAMLRATSAYGGGDGSARDGVRRVKDFLTRVNVDNTNFEVYDGSGLAQGNITTCRATVGLLEAVWQKPYKDIFYDSLPVAGDPYDTSSMRKRMLGSSAAFNARVKTGSLDRARAHAGYIKDAAGRDIAFCIVTNNFKGIQADVNDAHESVIIALAEANLKR